VEDGDSSGISRCFSAPKAKRQVHELKTPQESLLDEEAEVMPAESVRLQRKSTSTKYEKELPLVIIYDFWDSSFL
jgi:hypothetical protein